MPPPTREDARDSLAKEICALPYSRLMEWGISRSADVTGLDTIGLPVYTSCRPPGTVITVSAGKGLTKQAAKAGAILEGVELWAAEHPHSDGWSFCDFEGIKTLGNHLPLEKIQLAHSAPVYPKTQIAWDRVTDVFRENDIWVPSDLVWLVSRVKPPFQYFQTSSNGLAAGTDPEDALLQAVYEVVERDGWSISEHIREVIGLWPDKVSLECELPKEVQFCVEKLYDSNVSPFLFDLTSNLGVPIFGCTLIDPSDASPGVFAGYGCSLNPATAARRAITEAAQARAAYIGAARDDLFRRKFVLMKKVHSGKLIGLYQSLPFSRLFSEFPEITFSSTLEEWTSLRERLQQFGISECYSKVLYQSEEPKFCIIRAVLPQCESPMWEHWTAGPRAKRCVKEKVKQIQHV